MLATLHRPIGFNYLIQSGKRGVSLRFASAIKINNSEVEWSAKKYKLCHLALMGLNKI